MKLIGINTLSLALRASSLKLALLSCVLLTLLLVGGKAQAAAYQPDLMVKLASEGDGSYQGGGIFETTAVSQSRSQAAFQGTPAVYQILLKNAGDATDSFVVRGNGGDTGFTVRYLDEGGVDRSAALSGSGYATATLAPGQSLLLQLQVTPVSVNPGVSYRVTVSAASATEPARIDQVKTETVACGSTAAVIVSSPPDSLGPPGSVVNYPYTVTNVGSGVNSFTLTVTGSTEWPMAIYADDGAGGGVAGDGVRQVGENQQSVATGPLAPGGAYRFFVAVTIPQGTLNGAHADSTLAVAGGGAGATDQVTTSAVAATISLQENVRNLTQGGAFAVTASALPGDTLEYRMSITNSGSSPATTLSIDSPIPLNTALVPGTLWVGKSAGGDGSPCAAAECGFVRESSGSIIARLGQGATDALGGTLSPGKTVYVFFRVQVE